MIIYNNVQFSGLMEIYEQDNTERFNKNIKYCVSTFNIKLITVYQKVDWKWIVYRFMTHTLDLLEKIFPRDGWAESLRKNARSH